MRFLSGGEVVAVDSELAWVDRLVGRATGHPEPAAPDLAPTVAVRVEAGTAPFDRTGLRTVPRCWPGRAGWASPPCWPGRWPPVRAPPRTTCAARTPGRASASP